MRKVTIIIITGHPATGKTTLATSLSNELKYPLIDKDGIKENLADLLGWSDNNWSIKLSKAAVSLMFLLSERLISTGVNHIMEANFNPEYADKDWQDLMNRRLINVIQVRCETHPEILLRRYNARIASGVQHPIHRNLGDQAWFQAMLREDHLGWINIPGARISVNTDDFEALDFTSIMRSIQPYLLNITGR